MTSTAAAIGSSQEQNSLQRLAQREEVLEICFWFQGEGFGDRFTVEAIRTFLGIPDDEIREALESLAAEGALLREAGSYSFSGDGRKKAGRLFHETFAEFQVGTHGECTAGCCDSDEHDHDQAHGSPPRVG